MFNDPSSSWWVVVYTEMETNIDVLVLQEEYDNYVLRSVSTHTIKFSRELDFIPIMSNQVNVDEYLGVFLVIESTNLADLYPTWRERGEKRDESSPGRVGTEVDCMY